MTETSTKTATVAASATTVGESGSDLMVRTPLRLDGILLSSQAHATITSPAGRTSHAAGVFGPVYRQLPQGAGGV